MGFGNFQEPAKIFVTIDKTHKLFKVRNLSGENVLVDSLTGFLYDVQYFESEFEGKPMKSLMLKFVDDEGHNDFVFSTGFNSSYCRTLLNALAGVQGQIGLVAIKIYENDKYTNLRVYNNFEPCRWAYKIEDMPELKKFEKDNGEVIFDDSRRMLWFKEVVLPMVQEKLPTFEEARALVAPVTHIPMLGTNNHSVQNNGGAAGAGRTDARGAIIKNIADRTVDAEFMPVNEDLPF